jgi:hypothetical protein
LPSPSSAVAPAEIKGAGSEAIRVPGGGVATTTTQE